MIAKLSKSLFRLRSKDDDKQLLKNGGGGSFCDVNSFHSNNRVKEEGEENRGEEKRGSDEQGKCK